MSARLIPLTDSPYAPIINIQRPVLLVGRHPECDVRIDLSQVSRRHCCLAQSYDRILIRDLGSRNGVRVNGRIVSEARLQHGDEIAIAHLIYRLETTVVAARPSPPPRPAPAPAPAPVPVARTATPHAGISPTPSVETDEDEILLLPLEDEG